MEFSAEIDDFRRQTCLQTGFLHFCTNAENGIFSLNLEKNSVTQARTSVLQITSQVLYHWTISPYSIYIDNYIIIQSKVKRKAMVGLKMISILSICILAHFAISPLLVDCSHYTILLWKINNYIHYMLYIYYTTHTL
jgi:hypothetical protein